MEGSNQGTILSSLPMESLVANPLLAMVKAQAEASHTYMKFINTVCFDQDKDNPNKKIARTVEFYYKEANGEEKKVLLPVISLVSHPNLEIQDGTIDFSISIDTMESVEKEDSKNIEVDAKLSLSFGWFGSLDVKAKGAISSSEKSKRSTDTRSEYKIHASVKTKGAPEIMNRVIEKLVDAALPKVEKGKQNTSPNPPN